jgi:GNAT superfamily N-acetyltransferase
VRDQPGVVRGGPDQTSGSARQHLSDEKSALKGLLVALPGPAPRAGREGRFGLPVCPDEPGPLLGAAEFGVPTADNTHLLDDLFIQVTADARRAGIGTALFGEVHRIAAGRGRTTIIGWTEHRVSGTEVTERVNPSAGEGYLPADGATRFAESLGVELGQVERMSRLPLPRPPRQLDGLLADAQAHAVPAYEVVSWTGRVPEKYLDGVAAMYYTLSVDAPSADLDLEPEHWDAERVRHHDAREHLTGTGYTTVALVAGTEQVAALTHLHSEPTAPGRVEQWTTAVAPAHRGHRLGMLVKVANLQLLATQLPGARHVDTWNAGENAYMLAINTRLGFRLHAVTGAWQARLN